MSEANDRVSGISELPIFPLSVVLFPGVPLPLHIFEPRYRQMLSDIQVGNRFFGLCYFDSSIAETEIPPAGQIGCVAEVTESQPLPDGRSNILTIGLIRFRIEEYVDSDDPYLVARVSFFEDDEEDSERLRKSSREVADSFTRIARAVRIINNERANLPDISETEPQKLSFLVAAAMEVDTDAKMDLLELRSTSDRLHRLKDMLTLALSNYEERARVHEVARGNGHSGKKIELE